MSEQVYAYTARRDCGCVRGVTVDLDKFRSDTSEAVADWIKRGLTIERVTIEAARTMKWDCPTHKPDSEQIQIPSPLSPVT